MKKILMVSTALVCFGLFFTGCNKQTEADLQKVEQDIKSGAGKGEVIKDAEAVFEDVKEEVKSEISEVEAKATAAEDKAKETVDGAAENLENK